MTKFKICGIKDLINAKTVRNANADFMGFVFVPGSRRKLDMSSAKTLIDSYRDSTGSGGPLPCDYSVFMDCVYRA